jgi:hypothetical protein
MSAHVVQSSESAHVTLRIGTLVAQFYVNRHGLAFPAYLYDNSGYSDKYTVNRLEAFPDALLLEVTRLVRKYQTQFILKGDT